MSVSSLWGAEPIKPRTIKQYFLQIPETYLGISDLRRQEILKNGPIEIDLKRGFLSFQNSIYEETQMAILKNPNGPDYLVVSYAAEFLNADGSDKVSESKLTFLKYDAGQWTDITTQLFPDPFDKNLTFDLPRYQPIIVVRENGVVKYSINWIDGKLVEDWHEPTEVLTEFKDKTKTELVGYYGPPHHTREFLMSACCTEFTIGLWNTYPPSNPANAHVAIQEIQWDYPLHHMTMWLHRIDGEWRVVTGLRWKKGVDF